jgi:hypothetical protein
MCSQYGEFMMTDAETVLSRLVDGESLDPGDLERALRQQGAVETLLDFAELRQRMRALDDHPSGRFYQRRASQAVAGRGPGPRRSSGARVAALVASLLVATMAGIWVGTALGGRPADAGPPTPSRVIRLSADQSWQPVESSESRQP